MHRGSTTPTRTVRSGALDGGGRRRLLYAVLLAGIACVLPIAASAEQPAYLSEPITDLTSEGVLAADMAQVEAALNDLEDGTDYRLWVTFVDTFDGIPAQDWATAAAETSSLGETDVLLAVAVVDRAFAIDADLAVSDSDYNRAYDAASDALGDAADGEGTWAAAVVATAQALENSAPGWVWPVVIGGSGALLGGVWWLTRRTRARTSAAAGRVDPRQAPTAELVKQSGSALVAIDDELRTFEQEVGFAEAQFGSDATGQAGQVLAQSKTAVQQAFAWRSQLERETDERSQRQLAIRILETCHDTHEQIAAQGEAIEKLRTEQEGAPDRLRALGVRAREVAEQVKTSREQVAAMRAQYPDTALTTVQSNPEHAGQLIDAARGAVATGEQHVAAGDLANAVAQARVAENALGQATQLLDAVGRAQSDLAQAGAKLQQASASISSDLTDAARLAPEDASVRALVSQAQAAIATAAGATGPGGDPLAALAGLADTETALDAALAPYREAAEVARRASAQLAERSARLESAIRSSNAYIDSRRGAVGPQARTELAEAIRLLAESHRLATTEPQRALALLQHGEQRVSSANQLAQHDVAQWDAQQRGRNSGGGIDLDSLLLGGILLGDRNRPRGGYTWGGGWSSGGSNGGGWSGGGSSRGGSSRGGSSRGSSSRSRSSRSSSRSSSRRSRGGRF